MPRNRLAQIDDWTVGEIKSALMRCERIPDVNHTAVKYQRHVMEMRRMGGYWKTMAIQIENLAKYRRTCIAKGWPDGPEPQS